MTHQQITPGDIATRIRSHMKAEDGPTERVLARNAGIPQSSLNRKLNRRPETITIGELIGISRELGVTIAQLASPSSEVEQ